MSEIKNRTSEEIETMIQTADILRANSEKTGDYISAENSRLKVEQLKKDLEARKIYEMEMRHKREIQQLNNNQKDELNKIEKGWDHRFHEHGSEGERLEKDMNLRHEAELQKLKADLDKQLPTKTKESSQMLNLRKMEEHMVKQKNYVQAHRVQARIQELEGTEKGSWMSNRDIKIETSLNQLRAKQAVELTNLKKKIMTSLEEKEKEKKTEDSKLDKKFTNFHRELKMQQEKEVLHFKGQFRSKGGQSSPMTSKSRIK